MPELNCLNPECNAPLEAEENYDAGEWALVHKGELAGLYHSFETASSAAEIRFHCRRCQIRQISTPSLTLAVSAENVQEANGRLFILFQKWTRAIARRFFPESEMSY